MATDWEEVMEWLDSSASIPDPEKYKAIYSALTAGEQAERRVAELEARVGELEGANAAANELIGEYVGTNEALTAARAEADALRAQVESLAGANSQAAETIHALVTSEAGLRAQVETLAGQVEDLTEEKRGADAALAMLQGDAERAESQVETLTRERQVEAAEFERLRKLDARRAEAQRERAETAERALGEARDHLGREARDLRIERTQRDTREEALREALAQIDCPRCGGSGYVPGECSTPECGTLDGPQHECGRWSSVSCPDCEGTGRHPVARAALASEAAPAVQRPAGSGCHDCGNWGRRDAPREQCTHLSHRPKPGWGGGECAAWLPVEPAPEAAGTANETKRLNRIATELGWLTKNSDGVRGLRLDGSVLPWSKVLSLYLPATMALIASPAPETTKETKR